MPSLRFFSGDSSNVLVSSTDSIRKLHPILGLRSSPAKVRSAPGYRLILLMVRTDSFDRKFAI